MKTNKLIKNIVIGLIYLGMFNTAFSQTNYGASVQAEQPSVYQLYSELKKLYVEVSGLMKIQAPGAVINNYQKQKIDKVDKGTKLVIQNVFDYVNIEGLENWGIWPDDLFLPLPLFKKYRNVETSYIPSKLDKTEKDLKLANLQQKNAKSFLKATIIANAEALTQIKLLALLILDMSARQSDVELSFEELEEVIFMSRQLVFSSEQQITTCMTSYNKRIKTSEKVWFPFFTDILPVLSDVKNIIKKHETTDCKSTINEITQASDEVLEVNLKLLQQLLVNKAKAAMSNKIKNYGDYYVPQWRNPYSL